MKKVLILASVASMIDQFNMDNIKILQGLDYQVEVACNFKEGNSTSEKRIEMFKKELIERNINFYEIPFPRKILKLNNLVMSYKEVKLLFRNNKYDIVHCHSPIGGVIARVAVNRLKDSYTKVIYTAHGFHFYKGSPLKNWLLYFPIEKYCAKLTDCLITINKEDYQRAVKNKFLAKNIVYVPGIGVNTKKYGEMNISKLNKRKELGLNEEIVLISVGELNSNKNHKVIIEAISQIEAPIRYLICGKGKNEKFLKELVKKKNLENKVNFLGYRSDTEELLSISDIFCFPSYREGLSVALMEAMASGLPIICSNIRGNIDLIRDKQGGFLVNPNDINEFKSSIEKLIDNQELRKSMGKVNIINIKEFDTENVNKSMSNIYKGVAR